MKRVHEDTARALKDDKGPREDRILKAEREGYERGLIQGEQVGREIGEKKLEALLSRMTGLLEELEGLKGRIFVESEKELVELAVAIAEKIIHQEISLNREVIVGIVKGAVSRVVDRQVLRVKVNPLDFEILNQKKHLISSPDGVKHLTLEADGTVPPGGCLIEANGSEVDARLEAQQGVVLAELEREMAKP
jgi:flagellar assembly protein FliH